MNTIACLISLDKIFPIICVAFGWGLNEVSNWVRRKYDWRKELLKIKIETYAEWISGMEENLNSYALQSDSNKNEYKTPLCHNRLMVIENDKVVLQLIRNVQASIPNYGSKEFRELSELAHCAPDTPWQPFEEAKDKLLDHIRTKTSS